MSEEPSAWVCCQCGLPNFDTMVCFICEHGKCNSCKILTEEQTKQVIEGNKKANAWLVGQKLSKETFNREIYKKNKDEEELEELREEMESQLEESGERKIVTRKKQ